MCDHTELKYDMLHYETFKEREDWHQKCSTMHFEYVLLSLSYVSKRINT